MDRGRTIQEKEPMVMEKYAAIVLSAGSGSRMKSNIPKQYMDLLGKPVIYYSLKAFQESFISEIVLVCGKNDIDYCRENIVDKYHLNKVKAIVAGGNQRYDSVLEGLRALRDRKPDYVMIHDGARPMLDQGIIGRLADTVSRGYPCVAGMPAKDTMKLVDDRKQTVSTPDRAHLWQVQTPQVFAYDMILMSYEKMIQDMRNGVPMPAITDDAMAAEYACHIQVRMVEGRYENIKITTPEDLDVAALYLKREEQGYSSRVPGKL